YFGGGSYPVGGAARMAETIAPMIRAAGGELLRSAEVAEVVVEGNRAVGVRMATDGAVLRAPLIISDAGVANTFGPLVPAPSAERPGLRAALTGRAPSIAPPCLYVGLHRTARALGLERSNIWVYPDERHEHTLAASADAAMPPPAYISFPSAK